MRRIILALALTAALLTAAAAEAQVAVPIHNNVAYVGTATGSVDLLAARFGSLLGLQNDHAAAVIYCTVDGTAAAANTGIRINAAGGSVLLDSKVPRGPLRCYSATESARLLIQEGM